MLNILDEEAEANLKQLLKICDLKILTWKSVAAFEEQTWLEQTWADLTFAEQTWLVSSGNPARQTTW